MDISTAEKFEENLKSKEINNSVVVPVIRRIAEEIAKAIENN